ncbi:ICOS ligand isoform X1 [Kogia breviceps]|uniref:ICOS ligand isoform X1 n=1 Tax=Kogia breviceps TaxID=27615 RepID=UPI0034D1E497
MSLGFLEYGSAPGKLKHLDDVTDVVRRDVEEWGPFDLAYGSTPPRGHACDHPPAWYLYQFHRILQYARPRPGSPQPFFWMFVDNLVLTERDRVVATRFLETDPVTIQDVHGSTIQDAVHVWSNIPAVKSPGLFLLLLCGLRAEVQEEEVRAMVGSDVWLSCIYPKGNSFDLNDLYVYWQISVPGKRNANSVVTYYLSGNSSAGHGNNHYRGRARLSLDAMKRGNFSLHLHDVSPRDEQTFSCLVFRKSLELEKILEVTVTLNVAANYSTPVVSGPSQDEEFTFTCTSTNGYPRPNVYWINKTDNSLLDDALQNSTVSLNARGLYNVVSVLRVRRSPTVDVGCCIENVLLHQNLTSGQTEMFTGTKDSITEDPVDDTQDAVNRPVLSVLAVLAVAVAVATGWLCKRRCPYRSYAGAQAARPELELTEHV